MCLFGLVVISPHLVLLHSDLPNVCDLNRDGYAVGSLARNNASLGLGVVSAGVRGARDEGWIVTLFDTIKSDVGSGLLEWTFQNGSCWFELQDQLDSNQSDHVWSN